MLSGSRNVRSQESQTLAVFFNELNHRFFVNKIPIVEDFLKMKVLEMRGLSRLKMEEKRNYLFYHFFKTDKR